MLVARLGSALGLTLGAPLPSLRRHRASRTAESTDELEPPVRKHAHEIRQLLQQTLSRECSVALYSSVVDAAVSGFESSKPGFLAQRLQIAGPPLHLALDLIFGPSQRAAVA